MQRFLQLRPKVHSKVIIVIPASEGREDVVILWNRWNGVPFEGRTLFLISVKCSAVARQENDRNVKSGLGQFADIPVSFLF